MNLMFFIKGLLGSLLLPPGNGLLLLGLALLCRRRRWAFGTALAGGLLLLAQSLPIVSNELMASLERQAGTVARTPDGAQAIVVLGGGVVNAPPEYGGHYANSSTLARVRHGAELARRWGLPVLVTGGVLPGMRSSEAAVMAKLMSGEFGVPVRWQEDQSLDTGGNARLSAAILQPLGIRRVAVVTHAVHMPRAVAWFEAAGFEVVQAPTHFATSGSRIPTLLDFIPRASSLQNSYNALHEWLGMLWMRLSDR